MRLYVVFDLQEGTHASAGSDFIEKIRDDSNGWTNMLKTWVVLV